MWGSSKIPVKKNKIPAPPGSQASPKILKRKKNHYTTNPPACPPPPRGQQPKKPWHKAFAQGISISTPKRSALAPKKPWLSKSHEPKPLTAGSISGNAYQGGNRQTIPRIRLRRILGFCAFAEKNAVSLAKPGCKGALAHKKPFLTKSRASKPTNSAYAEFGYRLPVPDKET